MSDVQEKAELTMREILARMGLRVDVASRIDEEGRVALELSGDDVAAAIGQKGQTLDALQLVVSRIANRGLSPPVFVVADGAGFRGKREGTLREMALRLREKALATQEPVTVEGMNAAERRVIHGALAEAGGVSSRSEGHEPHRVLVIERAIDSSSGSPL
ncbi:MAG: R3H domain-containing nucleic acid-binding protein [Myxococcota bacterium]